MENTVREAGILVVGALLEASVRSLTGTSHQGKEGGDYQRHGFQPGAVYLGGSKVRITRPRVRKKGGGEAKIPAYELLADDSEAGAKVMRIASAGVSTRDYSKAIEDAAFVAGISKSNLSRRLVEQTSVRLKELMERKIPKDLLVITIDGIHMGSQVVVCAVGIDSKGKKHALGVADGTSENKAVVSDLLRSLIARGLDVTPKLLFLIDGAKALKSAILETCGSHHEIQRCREHKIRNVTARFGSLEKVRYVRTFMRAAWKLDPERGIAKMKELAKELEIRNPDAARSLLEGLEDSFTVNRLGLPPMLIGSLQSTNIGESVNSILRKVTGRITNFQSGKDQALRWAATGMLEAESRFRTIKGHNQIWILETALGRQQTQEAV